MNYEYAITERLLTRYRDGLEARLALAQKRADRLSDASRSYEEETEDSPTPEQDRRLNRLILAFNHAERLEDMLRLRLEKIDSARTALEDEFDLADGSAARRQRKIRAKARG